MEGLLTPYEQKIFKNVDEKVQLGQLYNITKDREDLTEFIATLEKYSEAWFDCLIIDKENLKFKRVHGRGSPEWCKEKGIKHWMEDYAK